MKRHQKPTRDKRRRATVSVQLRPRTRDLLTDAAQGEGRSLSYLLADWIETAIGKTRRNGR